MIETMVDQYLKLGDHPKIIAHRGFSAAFPENTLAAIRAALDLAVDGRTIDMVEIDVTSSADGEVVVIHDDTLERTTNGRGPVAEQTLEEIRSLDAGAWFRPEFEGERVPLLSEVLELVRDRALLNIEIKRLTTPGDRDTPLTGERYEEITERVAGLVADQEMDDQVLVSCFDPRALLAFHEHAPGSAHRRLVRAEGLSQHEPGRDPRAHQGARLPHP